jgi:uncharacterized protein
MGHMSLHNQEPEKTLLTHDNKMMLLEVAATSIKHGLKHGQPIKADPTYVSDSLQFHRASFVTLKIEDNLRGCIGSLKATRPLITDVVNNAYQAAFGDPRFQPLTWTEFELLNIGISILTSPENLNFTSEADLIRKLQPGIDGLILEEGGRRGTFLPSLWEDIPDPLQFLKELKRKTGLPPDYWSSRLRVLRYSAESFQLDRTFKGKPSIT